MAVLNPTVLNNPRPCGEQRPTQYHHAPPQALPPVTLIRSGGWGLPIRGYRSAVKPSDDAASLPLTTQGSPAPPAIDTPVDELAVSRMLVVVA